MRPQALSRKQKQERKERVQQKTRLPYGFAAKVILGVVGTVGILSLAAAAPNLFQAIRWVEKRQRRTHRRYRSPAYVRQVVANLARRGLVSVWNRDGETLIRLTEKGKHELLRYTLKEKNLTQKKWDHKWRIVAFDIPEKRRGARDRVRRSMQSFGFERLQASVWIYPYECEQVIALLKAEYRVGKEVIYMVAQEMENDAWLKKKFHLS